jgi:hypothetical protein
MTLYEVAHYRDWGASPISLRIVQELSDLGCALCDAVAIIDPSCFKSEEVVLISDSWEYHGYRLPDRFNKDAKMYLAGLAKMLDEKFPGVTRIRMMEFPKMKIVGEYVWFTWRFVPETS